MDEFDAERQARRTILHDFLSEVRSSQQQLGCDKVKAAAARSQSDSLGAHQSSLCAVIDRFTVNEPPSGQQCSLSGYSTGSSVKHCVSHVSSLFHTKIFTLAAKLTASAPPLVDV